MDEWDGIVIGMTLLNGQEYRADMDDGAANYEKIWMAQKQEL
jgi:hypothetical protein